MKNIRIEKIADMVEKGVILADIGTDHALLPILLVKSEKCEKVYACDIAEGPLSSAKENIHKNGMSDFVQPVLSDGLNNVPAEVNAIVIAGMGFETAKEILEADLDRLKGFQQIIVEVNRDWHLMRAWISEHHYSITKEAFVHERGHDYVILCFTAQPHESYSGEEIILGPFLMKADDPAYIHYCFDQLQKLEWIIEKRHVPSDDLMMKRDILKAFLENKKTTI